MRRANSASDAAFEFETVASEVFRPKAATSHSHMDRAWGRRPALRDSYAERIFAVFQSKITGVARFEDGDSGFVGDTEIRLHCIDAAEYDTIAGREAAQFAWREIDGQHLTCTRRQRKLSWGRVVVSCVFDTGPNRGRNVNRLLVDAGHARYVSALCAAEALSW